MSKLRNISNKIWELQYQNPLIAFIVVNIIMLSLVIFPVYLIRQYDNYWYANHICIAYHMSFSQEKDFDDFSVTYSTHVVCTKWINK